MSPSSTSDVALPSYSTSDVALPSYATEDIAPLSCSAEDVAPPPCSTKDATSPHCSAKDFDPTSCFAVYIVSPQLCRGHCTPPCYADSVAPPLASHWTLLSPLALCRMSLPPLVPALYFALLAGFTVADFHVLPWTSCHPTALWRIRVRVSFATKCFQYVLISPAHWYCMEEFWPIPQYRKASSLGFWMVSSHACFGSFNHISIGFRSRD